MKVKYKDHNGKWQECEGCIDGKCPKRDCFHPGFYQHRSCNNRHDSGCDNYRTCMTNQYHGCPDNIDEEVR